MMQALAWTEDRVEALKKLHEAGLTCSQIAAELGFVTRNSVIGKVHRLGLSRDGRPKIERPKRVEKPRPDRVRYGLLPTFPRLPREAAKAAPADIPASLKIPLLELRDCQCHFPTSSEHEAFAFCGHPATGGPYCPAHTRFATAPKVQRSPLRRVA